MKGQKPFNLYEKVELVKWVNNTGRAGRQSSQSDKLGTLFGRNAWVLYEETTAL